MFCFDDCSKSGNIGYIVKCQWLSRQREGYKSYIIVIDWATLGLSNKRRRSDFEPANKNSRTFGASVKLAFVPVERASGKTQRAGCYGILLRIMAATESATITIAPLGVTPASTTAKTAAINDNGCIIGLSGSN